MPRLAAGGRLELEPPWVHFCTGAQRFPPGPVATRASVSPLSKAAQCQGVSGKARGSQLLVSIPGDKQTHCPPTDTSHGRGGWPGFSCSRRRARTRRGWASSAPCQGAAGARGQPGRARTVPLCWLAAGGEEGALLDVEEGSGRVRGHSWAGSGRGWRGTGLGDHGVSFGVRRAGRQEGSQALSSGAEQPMGLGTASSSGMCLCPQGSIVPAPVPAPVPVPVPAPSLGHFGVVRLCRERSTGSLYAAKFVKMRQGQGGCLGVERAQVEREVTILRQLHHPNIIQLHELFASTAEVVLVLELISGGELFDFIAEKEMLSEEEAIEFLGQILCAVEYLHARLIAHFDLKVPMGTLHPHSLRIQGLPGLSRALVPLFSASHGAAVTPSPLHHPLCPALFPQPENIMLQDKDVPKPSIKIIDFGLAQQLGDGITFKSLSGTPQYIAPEVINYEPLSPATDMLSGLSPFQGETDAETLSNVVAGAYVFEEHCFSQTSEVAKDFIRQLLVKEPERRMTAAECLLHPWIKPLSRKQVLSRSRSSINMRNFRKFNARRKWKLSYNTVSACNHLCRTRPLRRLGSEDEELRCCESDQEEERSPHTALLRRRRNSCS
ncbi:hypothetical protein DV515_00015646 [Chloebia gouldiae]|uniref:Protein kinase domain-containing protein n=1 Tax=Chloebia gouldiae TaxID=44316 RepID=A0A3L8RW62_CHLGU|nr:hypothetical protein DV515_00015646 [Chloebia gouldiae]